MAKKRTGLDALREYEARSGRQTQSENQQTGNAGSSGGTWRSGLDALREYEASGGGQNVKNGPYNPDYRTNTRKATPQSYEAAYQQYKQIANSINHDQLSGYLRTMQERQNQIIDSINHDQMSGFRWTLQEKERQQQRKVQTGTAAQQAATNAGQDYSRLIGLNQFDGELERRAAEWQRKQQAAQGAAALDQERGRRRTSEEYGKRIDALEAASDYARAQNAEGGGLPEFKDAYDKVNAGRETPMTLDEMQNELAYTRYKKAVLDKSVSGRVGEYAGDLATQFISGGANMALGGLGMVLGYLEQGANGAAAWVLRDLAKAVPDGSIKDKMLSLADDFSSYYTGESMTAGEETARYYRDELNRIGDEIEGKYKGVPLWIQQQMPSAGNMLFGAGLSGIAGVNNLVTLGLTSGGNSALEAKDKGASDAQALAYGVVAGGLEVFSERLFGGNPIYDADAGLVNQAVGKLTSNKTIMKILNSKAFDIASEGLEEVVTEVLDPVAEWAIYNGDNTEFADAASIGNAFLGGVFLSAVGNVADAPKQLQQARYERVLRTAGSELADIAQSVDSADVQEAAQVIRDKIAYGVTLDAADIGAVLDAMDQAGETVDVEQVREAVDAEENEAKAAQAEAAFQTYNQYADERDAKARDAEKASWARSQENTEAINDAEADSAADAFEKLNEAEVKGAADARARQQTEEARAERTFTQESREDADRLLTDAARRYGFDDRMTSVLLSGYDGAQDAQQYAEDVNAAYEYGRNGMSLSAAQRAAQGIGKELADEAWSAGREIANGEKAGAARPDDGGKRNAGMDSGGPVGAVAGGTGGAAARPAAGREAAERIGLENRVSASGQPYLSGKDIGLSKGSAQRSFREAPQSTWTDGMKAAAETLRSAGFTDVHFTVGAVGIENQRAKVTRSVDGVAMGDTVWINAAARRWTVKQLSNHEAFHRQVQDAPYLLDSVRAVVADELGEDGIQELAQRYAEAYEGCYDGAELDAYIEEICADAYAGMDRLPEEKARIVQQAAQRRLEAQSAEKSGETRGPPARYSAGEDEGAVKLYQGIDLSKDGRVYTYDFLTALPDMKVTVLPEVNEVRGKDGRVDTAEVVREGMKNARAVGTERDGKAFVQNAYTGRELRIDTASIRHGLNGSLNRLLTNARLGAAIGDVVKNAVPINALQNKADGVSGTYAMAAYATDNRGREFVSIVTVEQRSGDIASLEAYDVTHSVSGRQNKRSERVDTKSQGVNPSTNASNIKISDFLNVVKNTHQSVLSQNVLDEIGEERNPAGYYTGKAKFSADGSAATPQENDKTALAYFGRTYKWSETGYVLLNGARLDFSGRHEGGSGGYRSVDHRDIIDALGEDYGGGDYTGGMVRFMQEGNIRISPESGGINLAVMPTKAQMDSLSDFISKERGEVILDIDDASGNTISSKEYPRGTHANKVLQDIRNYFNDGTLPEVSNAPSVSQFRYSVAEDAQEATEGAAELQVEKLPQTNRDQFMRFATKITDDLVTPLTAQMETLRKEMRPRVLELVDEFLENDALKRSSVEAVFTEAYDRALELNQEFSEKYAALQYAIRKTPVTFTEEDTRQIEQYDYFDEAALRKLTIKEKGGVSIGELYSDLSGMLPELFPSEIKNPAKQIMRIASVYKRISKAQALAQQVESTNPEYFRQNAYNDFLEQLRKIVPKMRTERELAQISIEDETAMEKAAAERERRLAEEDARLAAEEAAKEPPMVYESLTMDSIPKKAQDYLRRVRGQTAAAIQQTLSMPFAARQEVLKPAIEEMMNEYLQTGRISQETVDRNFEESYKRGVEMDTEFYDQYKDVKTRLRDLKVTLSEADRADITDFNDFRRAAFGRLRIADEGGLPVDVAYKEMQQMAPELFPASVTHPADQLMKMFDVSKRIEKVQRSLDEYHGEDAEEFKRWAKNDYEASVENMLGALNVARRYAEARMRQQQARAVPTTMEEVKSLYADLKGLRRTYERAAAKNLLTAEDNSVLNRLLRGEITPEDVQGMGNAKGILAMYEAKADYDAAAAKIADWRRYRKGKLREQADNLLKNAEQAKDKKAGIEYSRETMTRNVRDIFPEADAEAINKTYFEPVRTASANANKLKNQLREQVKALDLSRKARKGDAVSEAHAVQLLGEAQDNIRYLEQHPRAQDRDGKTLNEWRQIVLDLWATSPGLDRAKIENAVETFRKIYDGLFEQMNDVRIRNGYEPINYRQGYFPHFQPGTTDGILGLMGKALGIDAEVSALPTTISGLTHTFKPGITYFGNALERIGFDTAYDAVEGFDKYVEGAASVICYTDAIQNLRALAQQVRYRTSDEGLRERVDDIRARDDLTEHQKELEIKEIMDKGQFSLSNFAVELDEYTNLLANKKSKYDRSMEHLGGRKLYNFMRAWQNRVAANMVAVNPASWLTNFGVITQAGAQLKTISVLKGMWQTLANIKTNDGLVEASDFLTNRAGSDPLVRTWQQSASAFLSTPMEWIDQFSAGTIVRARYMENVERGMSEETAMREADDFAANVMADRSKGAMPTLFEARNPLMKMFTQFQLEVNNTYSYLFKDLPREQRKKGVRYLALALFKFLIGGFLYNELYEYLIGRRPMLDPLGIVNDTVGDLTGYELNNLVDTAAGGGLIKESEPESAVGTIQNLAENVGQEAPFIGNLMGGGKLPFSSSMPNVKNILTALDSETATDKEKLAKVGKEMVNPAAYWLLPFGGGQIKKMWQGISALKRQGSYTANGRIQYPIYTDRKGDKANAAWRTLLFGKSATPEAQAWVEAGFGALSEKETKTYEAMRAGGVDQRDSYELIKAMSKVKKTDTQTKEQLQMQLLNAFDIEDSGKVLYYYNMMASDKERAQIEKLLAVGADMGEYLRYLQEKSGVTGEKDADGKTISGSVKAETIELIDGLNLTPEQKTELAKEDYTPTGFEPWTENHDRLYKAVSTGKDLRSTLKGLEKDGYEPKEIRAAITDMFRDEYLAADKAGKARLKGYLRNAFMVSGLSQKEAENKIKKWEEAQK